MLDCNCKPVVSTATLWEYDCVIAGTISVAFCGNLALIRVEKIRTRLMVTYKKGVWWQNVFNFLITVH